MTQQLRTWHEKRKIRKYEQELQNRLETIMYNIFEDMNTEESIEMFKNVSSLFTNKLESRLIMADEEKIRIENFLSV